MQWFDIPTEHRADRHCASHGCGKQAAARLEAGGVGTDYCTDCSEKIDGKRNPATGRFEVANWPKPRVSNPNFLSEELASFEAGQMKRVGTLTRQDHERGVMDAYARNIAQGMDEQTAMTKAGEDWRAKIEAQGAKEIANVKRFLGIKSN